MMTQLSNTNVSFLTGVPFDMSYAHTRWFESRSEQYSYFKRFEKFTHAQHNVIVSNGRGYIDLNKNYDDVFSCNYLMYQNNQYGKKKWFYAFITKVQYINRNVTRVFFEIDVIQTWRFEISFKQSFINREHENGNARNFTPESVQIGNEYETVKEFTVRPHDFYYFVICSKQTIDFKEETEGVSGSFFGSPNTLTYYFYPLAYAKEGAGPEVPMQFADTLGNFQYSSVAGLRKMLHELKENENAVNNIVSMFITEYVPIEVKTVDASLNKYQFSSVLQTSFNPGDSNRQWVYRLSGEKNMFLPTKEIRVGNVFEHINESAEKLRYYPYTVVEISDGRGNVATYKPESLPNGELVLSIMGGFTHFNNVNYALKGYNNEYSRSAMMSNALISNTPQDVAVLDDRTTAYLQGNKNSMEAQRKTWASDKKYSQLTQINRGVSSGLNMFNTGASGDLAHSTKARSDMIDDASAMTQAFINYNKAGSDYQNKINEQNAMLEDISNVPDNLVKQGSNVSTSVGNDLLGVRVTIKRVKPEYLNRVRNYFHMFGTKVTDLKIPNIHTRQYWNYIQTTMCNIQCDFYNDDIVKIREIFDRGITLWHTDDLYNYAKANGVI